MRPSFLLPFLALVPQIVACVTPGVVPPCTCQPSSPATPARVTAPQVSATPVSAIPPRAPRLEQLATERVALAKKRIPTLRLSYKLGQTSLSELTAAYREIAFAARDSGLRGEPLRQALDEYRKILAQLSETTHKEHDQGRVGPLEVEAVDARTAEADYWAAEAEEAP